jgi:hypothetical protein
MGIEVGGETCSISISNDKKTISFTASDGSLNLGTNDGVIYIYS